MFYRRRRALREERGTTTEGHAMLHGLRHGSARLAAGLPAQRRSGLGAALDPFRPFSADAENGPAKKLGARIRRASTTAEQL